MKSITEYIKLMLEGGHAVKCNPIPAYLAPLIYKEVEDKIHKWDNTIKMAPLGSIGKKNDDETTGDIDVAINIVNKSELLAMIDELFPGSEVKPNTNGRIVSINYNYNIDGKNDLAQIDFMMNDNIDWAKWRYSSPDLKNGESKYKAAPKVYLIRFIVSSIPVKGVETEYFDDGKIKKKWRYTFNQEGVFKYLSNHIGKRGNYVKGGSKEFKELVSNDPMNVMRFIFDTNDIDPKIFNTVENLWAAIHSDLWPWGDKALGECEERWWKEYINGKGMEECRVDPDEFKMTVYKPEE